MNKKNYLIKITIIVLISHCISINSFSRPNLKPMLDKTLSYSSDYIPNFHLIRSTKNISKDKMKKAIVVGASSGMGRQVAMLLALDGYEVGLVGRRIDLLESLQKKIPTKTYIKKIDVTETENLKNRLPELISDMGGLDLIFISIGGFGNKLAKNEWEYNKNLIDVDVMGFFNTAEIALNFFMQQKSGHLIGISSIDGVRGNALCPVYSGVKAFVAKYLEGTRNRMIQNKIPITITDIVPGWVDNEDTQFSKMPNTYWVAKTYDAALQIYDAIKNKEKRVCITKRWKIIDILLKIMPDWLYNLIGGL